jgi:hypothetical protein
MNRKFALFSLGMVFTLLFSACGGAAPATRTAAVASIENDIQVRTSANAAFAPASLGQELTVGAELKSGENGKARLDIQPDNTQVYIGPNTLFTLTQMNTTTGSPYSRLKMMVGKVWIILGGGSLDVETPGGVASVRGSLMGVESGDNGTTVTCLEGHCDITTGNGTSNLTGGQACDLTPSTPECQTRGLTGEENQDWQNNVPGSSNYIPSTETPTVPLIPTATPTLQATSSAAGDTGPDLGNFPSGINPLTGLPVNDPTLLNLPAVLISVPNFPPSARPQAGLSYAPWIFEIYIGEGMTRFLATFYGEEPAVEPYLTGSCEVRTEPFVPQGVTLGNRAWWDENGNGIQDPNETGIAGLCVSLYDTAGNVLQTTSTDSNGYYGFNVETGGSYLIGFEKPQGLDFTTPDVGYDDLDSDAAPGTGLTPVIIATTTDMKWDAGYIQADSSRESTPVVGSGTAVPQPGGVVSELPAAEVGPIRSMRLSYGTIGNFFQDGCIVAASGDPTVLAQVHTCKFVFGQDQSDINSALLDITEIHKLAESNSNPNRAVNYSGNVFSTTLLPGGLAADQLDVYWAWQDQSRFVYDPLSGAYARSADLPGAEDIFTPQTDRLTGRQLLYDNVIVMYVEHTVFSNTKMDINLAYNMGRAFLFRDGQMFPIYWSTMSREYEKTTGLLRPIFFTDINNNPIPLKPGHTWVHIFTPGSSVYEKVPGSGSWTAQFDMP